VLRVFYEEILEKGAEIILKGEEAHHLFRVLRAKFGEKVILLNGRGYRAYGRVVDSGAQKIAIDDLEYIPPSEIILCPALLKNKAMDFLIREATAIGVGKIILFYAQNSEVKIQNIAEKQVHWNSIARQSTFTRY
jgi:16S rRNA (uracil1498-N3)-methyltransferase